ncbi:hypothetical protein HU200_055334 [Digitaria exilis]|uniref:Uncharacterized protein n=1 Tax=Digitaria exilis TaxID=1010633 RepID=A0A835AJB0_9POAL|nr:hypothetical protein HU200_055334 [Digitaria exilis]
MRAAKHLPAKEGRQSIRLPRRPKQPKRDGRTKRRQAQKKTSLRERTTTTKITTNHNNIQQRSYKDDDASREGATPMVPSSFDHQGQGFHLENSLERQKEGNERRLQEGERQPQVSPLLACKQAQAPISAPEISTTTMDRNTTRDGSNRQTTTTDAAPARSTIQAQQRDQGRPGSHGCQSPDPSPTRRGEQWTTWSNAGAGTPQNGDCPLPTPTRSQPAETWDPVDPTPQLGSEPAAGKEVLGARRAGTPGLDSSRSGPGSPEFGKGWRRGEGGGRKGGAVGCRLAPPAGRHHRPAVAAAEKISPVEEASVGARRDLSLCHYLGRLRIDFGSRYWNICHDEPRFGEMPDDWRLLPTGVVCRHSPKDPLSRAFIIFLGGVDAGRTGRSRLTTLSTGTSNVIFPYSAPDAGKGRLASHTRTRARSPRLAEAVAEACHPDLRLLLLVCCYFAFPSPALRAHHRQEQVPPTPLPPTPLPLRYPTRDTGAIRFLGSVFTRLLAQNRCVFTGVRFTNYYTAPRLLLVRLRRTDCTASTDLPASPVEGYHEFRWYSSCW